MSHDKALYHDKVVTDVVSEKSPEVTTNSSGSRGDVAATNPAVAATSSQLRRRFRQLRPYLIGLETRWRLGGDSSLRWLRRSFRDVSWRLTTSPWRRGKSNMFDFGGDFFQSPAGLGDVSATSPRPAGDQGD